MRDRKAKQIQLFFFRRIFLLFPDRHSSQGFLKGDREEIKVEAIEEGNEEIAEEKIEEIDEKEFKEEIGRRIRKRRWTRRI